MKMALLSTVIKLALIGCAFGDMYLHNPRGSNNRLNGRNRDRTNANRLFDSQNNARGGYNVGNLYYYAGSVLPIQWTNQHSCSNPNNNCEIVIQYMCGDKIRDGVTEQTIPENRKQCKNHNCNTDHRFGMHENFHYYQNCKLRQRNKGLFVADQDLKGQSARFTRQNPQGTRRGYECPEERDYYPYWHSSPWKDIVVMTNDVKRCAYYKTESENVKGRYGCKVPHGFFTCDEHLKTLEIPNNKEQCERIRYPPGDPSGEKAVWHEYPSHNLPAPDCILSPWSRDNHLGNGRNGYMNTYNWTVPNIEADSCIMRIRYNISTNDYDSWNTGANTPVNIGKVVGLREDKAKERGYIFKNNPVVKVSLHYPKLQLRLAINTAQYGRTFQDRTHVFSIHKRPQELKSATIFNVNVRGKRGNIVQTYPAMEYDFVPNKVHLSEGQYVHFQWTGSNNNPANNAGEGRAGTDRSNVLLLDDPVYQEGKPKPHFFGQYGRNYFKNISLGRFIGLSRHERKKAALISLGSGPKLDDAATYFDLGPKKVTGAGSYFYMCTRNNNFSNRSQKGKIVVSGAKAAASSDTVNSVDTVNDNDNTEDQPATKDDVNDTDSAMNEENANNDENSEDNTAKENNDSLANDESGSDTNNEASNLNDNTVKEDGDHVAKEEGSSDTAQDDVKEGDPPGEDADKDSIDASIHDFDADENFGEKKTETNDLQSEATNGENVDRSALEENFEGEKKEAKDNADEIMNELDQEENSGLKKKEAKAEGQSVVKRRMKAEIRKRKAEKRSSVYGADVSVDEWENVDM